MMAVLGKIIAADGIQFAPSTRRSLYLGLNIAVLVLITAGAAISVPSNPRFFYIMLITALCSSPLLVMERLNGEYFLLMVYLGFSYMFFGFSDVMGILLGRTPSAPTGILSASEFVILVSLGGLAMAYHLIARTHATSAEASEQSRDWPIGIAVPVGLAFWAVGTAGILYWQVYVISDRTNATLLRNLDKLGPLYTTLFMLGQLVQPLGVMILAYAYAAYRRALLTPLIIVVACTQVVVGFIADYKGEAMLVGILVIITKTYIDGRLPKAWLAAAAVFVTLAFPIFQAQRIYVRGEEGTSAADTLMNIQQAFEKSVEANVKIKSGFGGEEYRAQTFWERASLKSSVDMIVERTGVDVPYAAGSTLTPILTAFVPRIFWSGKETPAVGQVFNKEFHVTPDADVYISPSHVGEVYWNFGWLGTLFILPATGMLLGYIGSRCLAYPTLSLTKMMIMFATVFSFVVRAEGSIATEYVVWMRSIAVIGILHLLFARARRGEDTPAAAPETRAHDHAPVKAAWGPYPNLLR